MTYAESGSWSGGTPPYGYDVLYSDASGRPQQLVRWKPDGEKEVYDPDGQKYVFNILKVTGTVIMGFAAVFAGFLVITSRRKRKES